MEVSCTIIQLSVCVVGSHPCLSTLSRGLAESFHDRLPRVVPVLDPKCVHAEHGHATLLPVLIQEGASRAMLLFGCTASSLAHLDCVFGLCSLPVAWRACREKTFCCGFCCRVSPAYPSMPTSSMRRSRMRTRRMWQSSHCIVAVAPPSWHSTSRLRSPDTGTVALDESNSLSYVFGLSQSWSISWFHIGHAFWCRRWYTGLSLRSTLNLRLSCRTLYRMGQVWGKVVGKAIEQVVIARGGGQSEYEDESNSMVSGEF